ncbi:MAG: hypothetical protein Q7I99_05450 [Acholeplasmataceae bacterium]|nr:hypothetical protein [Acholeplasmataceae bacterium]
MKKLLVKIFFFVVITCTLLFDYRIVQFRDNKILVANFDKKVTWNEVYDVLGDARSAEIYRKPYKMNRGQENYEYYVIFYTSSNLYNIKASEIDLDRVENMLRVEQVEMVEVSPVDLWFYGLLYVMVIVFPIMRKVE